MNALFCETTNHKSPKKKYNLLYFQRFVIEGLKCSISFTTLI